MVSLLRIPSLSNLGAIVTPEIITNMPKNISYNLDKKLIDSKDLLHPLANILVIYSYNNARLVTFAKNQQDINRVKYLLMDRLFFRICVA